MNTFWLFIHANTTWLCLDASLFLLTLRFRLCKIALHWTVYSSTSSVFQLVPYLKKKKVILLTLLATNDALNAKYSVYFIFIHSLQNVTLPGNKTCMF